jgi:hypothetical protein
VHEDTPSFLLGRDRAGNVRVVQMVALGQTAGALEHIASDPVETNRWAVAQIELVGSSRSEPWLPDEDVLGAFCALLAHLSDVAGIPLSRPFPDDLDPGVVWATRGNPRRLGNLWGRTPGWFMHLEVPVNSHWDMGAFRWQDALARARELQAVPGWPELQPNMRRPEVAELKRALAAYFGAHPPKAGFTEDNVYGPAAVAAVKRFQEAKGLEADGIVTPAIWQALEDDYAEIRLGNAPH